MDAGSTVVLVRRAKAGDREAWTALVERYYETWLRRYHGRLGTAVRRVYDTQDLVDSAIADAIRDLHSLRNEGVFFSWVTSIICHKMALARRGGAREIPTANVLPEVPDPRGEAPHVVIGRLDTYVQTLDAIMVV